jgi:hypothetical protein
MSYATSVRSDELVPIFLQIEDGNEERVPSAFVYYEEENLLANLIMVHVENGLYEPQTPITMPSVKFLKVVYVVFTDASRLVADAVY